MGDICGRPSLRNVLSTLRRLSLRKERALSRSMPGCLPSPAGQRRHDLLLQPAEVAIQGEGRCEGIVVREIVYVHLLADVEPGTEHEPQVVDSPHPRRQLLLVEALGVDRLVDDVEGGLA